MVKSLVFTAQSTRIHCDSTGYDTDGQWRHSGLPSGPAGSPRTQRETGAYTRSSRHPSLASRRRSAVQIGCECLMLSCRIYRTGTSHRSARLLLAEHSEMVLTWCKGCQAAATVRGAS